MVTSRCVVSFSRITKAISGKTSYLVRGDLEPGASKVTKAEEKNVKVIGEDELFDLIRSRKSEQPKLVSFLSRSFSSFTFFNRSRFVLLQPKVKKPTKADEKKKSEFDALVDMRGGAKDKKKVKLLP